MRVDKSVIVLFRQMNLFLNRELLDEKLTSSDVLYLALLYEQDGRTQDEMAEAYTVDRAATTRSLQGLEKKGLVRREVDTFDRRIRRVYLTEKAMQYRTAIRRMADDLADAYPRYDAKIYALGEKDIQPPGSEEEYKKAAKKIKKAIDSLIEEIKDEDGGK